MPLTVLGKKALQAAQSLRNILKKNKAYKDGVLEPKNLSTNSTNVKEIEVNKKPDGEFNWKINISEPVTLISDPKKAKTGGFFKRYFSAEQAFDPKTYRAFVTWDNAPKSLVLSVKQQDKAFQKAVKLAYGKNINKLDDETITLLNLAIGKRPIIGANAPPEIKALLDKPATKLTKKDKDILTIYYDEILSAAKDSRARVLEQLPESVRNEVIKMRVMVDTMTNYMTKNFGLSKGNTLTLNKNLGLYISEDFPLFTSPKWLKQVKNAIVNKGATETEAYQAVLQAKKMLTQMLPKGTPVDEIEGLLLNYINQNIKDRGSVLEMLRLGQSDIISQGKFGHILSKRKDIDKPFRLILGEEKNPIVRWNSSMQKMSAIISEHKFMTTIRDIAKSEYGSSLFRVGKSTSTGDITVDLKDLTTSYLANAGKNSNPLANVFTTPQYKEYLKQGIELRKANPAFAWWYGASGLTNANATSLSFNTHLRNLEGNIMFLALNGNLGPSVFKNILPSVKVLTKATPESLEMLRMFSETGLTNSGVRAQQLIRTLDDAVKNPNGWFEKIKRRTIDVAGSVYSVEDDVFKILSFFKERARYKAAFPNMSKHELDQYAIKIVTDTLPTYHKLIRPVKNLRRTPFGTFPAFTHEVFRTAKNSAVIGIKDVAVGTKTGNLSLIRAGAARLAGITTTALGTQQYIQFNYDRYNITADDRKAIEAVSQEWQKHEIRDYNSHIFWNKKTGDIETEYKNLTYSFPHAPIIQIAQQLYPYIMSDKGKEDFENGNLDNFQKVLDAIEASLDVFTNESLLAGNLLEVVTGKTSTGRPIYGKADPIREKALTAILHLAKVIAPAAGSIRTIKGLLDSRRSEKINNEFRKGLGVSDRGWNNRYADRIKSLSGIKHETLNLSKSFQSTANRRLAEARDGDNFLAGILRESYNIDWTNRKDVEKLKKEFAQRLQYSYKQQQELASVFYNFKKLKYYKTERIGGTNQHVSYQVDDELILDLLTDSGTKGKTKEEKELMPMYISEIAKIAGYYVSPSLQNAFDDLQKNQNISTEDLFYFEDLLTKANGTPLLDISEDLTLEEEE